MQKKRYKWMNHLKDMSKRANAQEKYVGDFDTKMLGLLTEFCQDLEKETKEVEPSLDPINTPVGDGPALDMFRVNSRLMNVEKYITRLRVAVSKIDKELWLEYDLQHD
ncbi:hypothetical protein D1007_09227 [Hordeum vulgare]|nr:hypothetical protein D1007_09227 [Hordeum vulgare]